MAGHFEFDQLEMAGLPAVLVDCANGIRDEWMVSDGYCMAEGFIHRNSKT